MSCPKCEQERKTEKHSQWIRNTDLSIEFNMTISIIFKETCPVTFFTMMNQNKMLKNKTTKKRKVLILSTFTVEECFEFLKMERK